MDGLILVDKPLGWTSFDVVNKLRRLAAEELDKRPKQVKVGHTGTLDPLATGLLVVLLGGYCKRAQEFSKLDKTYAVTMRLGQNSDTGDEEGQKTVVSDWQPTYAELEAALQQFTGEIMQTPPAYSAIKVNGQRAYDLARAGRPVVLEPRPVQVYSIQLGSYVYPDVHFTAEVSSGTYIRSLVADVGQALGIGAYMAGLQRTSVGQFSLSDAHSMDTLASSHKHSLTQFIKVV